MVTKKLRKMRRLLKRVQASNSRGVAQRRIESVHQDDFQAILTLDYEDLPYCVSLQKPLYQQAELSTFDEVVKALLGKAGKSSVEVSISQTNVFSPYAHFTDHMPIEGFLNYAGSMNLYIAQVPLTQKRRLGDYYNIPRNSTQTVDKSLKDDFQRQLSQLKETLSLPSLIRLKLSHLEYCNVWVNRKEAVSDWHYDFYENYLVVLKGKKHVKLLDYSCLKEGDARKAQAKSPDFKFDEGDYRASVLDCDLKENQALRIPQGWYHKVQSDAETIAVNFWFTGTYEKQKGLFPILLSSFAAETLFEIKRQSYLSDSRETLDETKIRESFLDLAKDPQRVSFEKYRESRFLLDIVDRKIDYRREAQEASFSSKSKSLFYEQLESVADQKLISALERRIQQKDRQALGAAIGKLI